LQVDLEEWVLHGTPPPPSDYPKLADGSLVPANSHAMGFPSIPGVPSPDGIANPLLVYDLGNRFNYDDLSGEVASLPPAIEEAIEPLVPKVDGDGNEIGGIHTVQQQAALGTYLGWNVTADGFAKGQYCSLWGSYVPFETTRAERIAAHDPRLSLEERYGTQKGFACVVKKAATKLVGERLLLQASADKLIEEASASEVLGPEAEASSEDKRIAARRCMP
jgi:hypothetical protein